MKVCQKCPTSKKVCAGICIFQEKFVTQQCLEFSSDVVSNLVPLIEVPFAFGIAFFVGSSRSVKVSSRTGGTILQGLLQESTALKFLIFVKNAS